MKITDFQLKDCLYDTLRSALWRAVYKKTEEAVILKIRKAALEDDDLQQEYRLLFNKKIPYVASVRGLFYDRDQTILIREEVPGIILNKFPEKTFSDPLSFLPLALSITKALDSLHGAQLLHRGLAPENLIYDSTTGTIYLTGLGAGCSFSEGGIRVTHSELKETLNNLHYISPEQTGRVDRQVDYRSDFYALGCLFYELLAGQPPFWMMAPLALIHAHVAFPPKPFSEQGVKVPPALEAMVFKLLQKDPDDRYQSLRGLIADCQICLKAYRDQNEAALSTFVPAAFDAIKELRQPRTLYGRAEEMTQLLQEFERAMLDDSRLVLMAGYSGAGKTSLARQLISRIKTRGGFFVSGKFEEYRRNVPYFAIAQALEQLCERWLLSSDDDLRELQKTIQTAVGGQGQVLIDLVPKLEVILGPQAALMPLGSLESQNRMDRVLQQFLGAICRVDHPLVLFIDDLQWADYASLRMLNVILSGEVKHLLVIGCYRSNEVDADPILMLALEALDRLRPGYASTIFVENLDLKSTNELVASMLETTVEESQGLSEILYEKTQGNPFYTIELLKLIHAEHFLTWDDIKGRWQWRVEKIRGHNLADNVVDVVVQKISFLPSTTLASLKVGACIGREFHLDDIAAVRQKAIEEIWQSLVPALENGIIDIVEKKEVKSEKNSSVPSQTVYFLHDRLQEGAYRMMVNQEALDHHRLLGQMLYERFRDDPLLLDHHLMSIVDHLNSAVSLLSEEEKQVLAALNHQAGLKAKASLAHSQAISSFEMALKLFGEAAWEASYETMVSAAKNLYVCYYLENDYEKADPLFEQLKTRVKTPSDQFDIYYNRMVQCMVVTDFQTTIETGREFIHLLGHYLPTGSEMADALQGEEERLNHNIEAWGWTHLLTQPVLSEENDVFYARALIRLLLTGYFIDYDLFRYTAAKTLNLAFERGIFPEIEVVLADYVLHLLNLGAYEEADQTLQLAKKIADKNNGLKAEIWHFQSAAVDIWVNSWDDSIRNYYTAMAYCAEEGNQEYTGYALDTLVNDVLCKGEPLSAFEEAVERALSQLWKIQHSVMSIGVGMYRQFIKCLRGQTHASCSFEDDTFSESDYVARHRDNSLLLAYLYGFKSFALYVNGDYLEGYQTLLAGKLHREVVGCFHHSLYLKFYAALFYPIVIDQLNAVERQAALDDWGQLVEWFGRLGELNPGNFLSKSLFVQAEKAAYEEHFERALFCFEDALDLAEKHDVLSDAALIAERFAYFWLKHDRRKTAITYIQKAVAYFEKWGATLKVKQLIEQFPELAPDEKAIYEWETSSPKSATYLIHQMLDHRSILKTAYALTGEIVLSKLMDKLVHIVLEAAGADFGALLLVEEGGELTLEISRGTLDESRHHFQSQPLSDLSDEKLPKTILKYVERTQEPVLLNLPQQEHRFMEDPYWKIDHPPRSVLCVPLTYQGRIICLLYLENRQMAGVFTPERIELLHMIAIQAAVAIQNAALYSKLENYKRSLEARIKEHTDHMNTLIASIAHEINTPVGIGITTASHIHQAADEILKAFDQGQLGKHQLGEFLKVAIEGSDMTEQNLNRVAELIQNFRRIALDQSLGEVKTFDLVAYLQDILFYLQPLLRKMKPKVHLKGEGPLVVESDPGAFSQILTNLIHNSLLHGFEHFEVGKGQIEITVALNAQDEVMLTYQDNGCGMTEEQVANVFKPLFTTKRDKGGSGLGGHIIYTLAVHQLQGAIECVSRPGEGTSFHLVLPKSVSKIDKGGV